MSEAYPWPLVKRLLEQQESLRLGLWPRDEQSQLPPGYRGRRAAEVGGFEPAVEAYADLELAVDRLPARYRRAVRIRYWEHRRTIEPWHLLVDWVWGELNG